MSAVVAPQIVWGDAGRRALGHSFDCQTPERPFARDARAGHQSRELCACLSEYVIDREVVCELLARELLLDAFQALIPMIEAYGAARVLEDSDLARCVMKLDHYSQCIEQFRYMEMHGMPRPPVGASRAHSLVFFDMRDIQLFRSWGFKVEESVWSEFCTIYKLKLKQGGPSCYTQHFLKTDVKPVVCYSDESLFAAYVFDPQVSPQKAQIFCQATLPVRFEEILAVMAEVELTGTWVPSFRFPVQVGLADCAVLSRTGRLDLTSKYHVNLPWPIADREVVLHGEFHDLIHQDAVALIFRSHDPQEYPYHPLLDCMPPPHKVAASGKRQFTSMFVEGACFLQTLDEETMCIRLAWNIDLKTKIPSVLISFVTRTFIKMGLNALVKACHESQNDPRWVQARKLCPWLYDHIKDRLKERAAGVCGCGKAPFASRDGSLRSTVTRKGLFRRRPAM